MTSLRFIRLSVALPILLAIAFTALNPTARGGFAWQLLLLASTPYLPVAMYVWWRLPLVPTERERMKLLVHAVAVVLLLVCADLGIEYAFGRSPSLDITLLILAYTSVVSVLYIGVAVVLYFWLRAAGVFARAAGGDGSGPHEA